MAVEKKVKGVLIPRNDIPKNWAQAKNFTPGKGEIIVYNADPTSEVHKDKKVRFKFGDGELNVDALPFFNSGVGEETPEGGEIFNDYENNKALTPYSSSFGTSTQAGACGYHFTKIGHKEYQYPVLYVPKKYVKDDVIYEPTTIEYAVGDILNIDANSHQYEIFRIVEIDSTDTDYHKIIIEFVERTTFGYNKYAWAAITPPQLSESADGECTWGDLALASDSLTDNWVWCTKKPNVGFPIPAFIGNIVAGRNNDALGYSTVALGRDNTAVGNHSTVFGRRNSAVGYVSLAAGFETIALSEQTVALGKQTVAIGKRSMAVNFATRALGVNSFAGGDSSITEEDAENSFAFGQGSHACFTNGIALGDHAYTRKDLDSHIVLGRYNRMTTDYTTDDTIFAIGNGADQNSRSNAFEIKEDGFAYINNGEDKLATETEVDNIIQPYKIGTLTSDGSILFRGTEGTAGNGGIGLGYQSTTTGPHSVTFGMYNSATNRATIAGGEHCHATGENSIALGFVSTASHRESFTLGSGLRTTADNQVIVGNYPSHSKITSDVGFAVGVGEGDNGTASKSVTGFLVYKDGHAEVQTQGQTANSVVINSKLQEKCDELLASIKDAGIELKDKTTGTVYTLSIDNGKLVLESI